jgi:hypothetical protein
MTINDLKDDPFLTPNQIAQIFAVKPYTVRMWIKDGKFDEAAILKINGRIKVRSSAVTKFAQENYGSEEKDDFV